MLRVIQAADSKVFLTIFGSHGRSSLSKAARIISFSADGWFYVLLIPVFLVLKPSQAGEYLWLALVGITTERVLYYVLKLSFRRRRPPNILAGVKSLVIAADEFSLPSGHTSAAFFMVTFLCLGGSLLFLPLYAWAAAVGCSRVILGVHFPTDILVGAMIGSSIAIAIL